MSGQWFYEAKSKRHRDKIHGADIIRTSMRRKPATLGKHLAHVLFWKGWYRGNTLTAMSEVGEMQEEYVSLMNRKLFMGRFLYVI